LVVVEDADLLEPIHRASLSGSLEGGLDFARSGSPKLARAVRWRYLGTRDGTDSYEVNVTVEDESGKTLLKSATVSYRGEEMPVVQCAGVRVRVQPAHGATARALSGKAELIIRDTQMGLVVPVDVTDEDDGAEFLARDDPLLPLRIVRWYYLGTVDGADQYKVDVSIEKRNSEPGLFKSAITGYRGKEAPVIELGPIRVQIRPASPAETPARAP
jgi:hypothetical protein